MKYVLLTFLLLNINAFAETGEQTANTTKSVESTREKIKDFKALGQRECLELVGELVGLDSIIYHRCQKNSIVDGYNCRNLAKIIYCAKESKCSSYGVQAVCKPEHAKGAAWSTAYHIKDIAESKTSPGQIASIITEAVKKLEELRNPPFTPKEEEDLRFLILT